MKEMFQLLRREPPDYDITDLHTNVIQLTSSRVQAPIFPYDPEDRIYYKRSFRHLKQDIALSVKHIDKDKETCTLIINIGEKSFVNKFFKLWDVRAYDDVVFFIHKEVIRMRHE